MSILNLIASEGFITVNKTLIKLFVLETALILGELASEEMYWEHTGKSEDGFFYSTAENLEENTSLSRYQQNKAIRKLEQAGILNTVVKGVPATKYFKFNQERLFEIITGSDLKNLKTSFEEICNKSLKNFKTSSQKTLKLVCKKLEGNNKQHNNNKKIINKNNNTPVLKPPAPKGAGELEKQFNELWVIYPKKQGKDKAIKSYIKAIKEGTDHEVIKKGLMDFVSHCQLKKTEYQFIPMGSTWFSQKRWEDDYKTLGYASDKNDDEDIFTQIAREEKLIK